MNPVKLFKFVPLGTIPSIASRVEGTRFSDMSLEDIRNDPDAYYDFIAEVIKQVHG